ncbi:MAG: TRAP transporter substrate-binding protein DctP [Verrucomicrobia bacterium]|nr:TRAP transporter substrate-binding protein DctP [Verrucomicrobiota bacterium]
MKPAHLPRPQFLRFILIASLGLSSLQSVALAAGPAKIRLGTLVPKGSSYYRQLQNMGEAWKKSSGGAVTLTIYPDGSMGGEAEMVRRIRQGQLQAGLLTSTGLSLIEPGVSGLQNMPMMFRDLADADYVGEKLRPTLEKRMEEKGFKILFWGNAGWVRFFTRTAVTTPDDMKKLKFWVWAGEPEQFKLMNDLGLKPVSLETNDILPGLKTGLIDAVPMPPFVALAAQVDTAAPYMLQLNYAPLVGAAVISKQVWDGISDETRVELLKAAATAGAAINLASRNEAEESVATMVKRGLKVHKPTAAEENTWREFVEKSYPGIRGKIVPEDVFDEVKKLLEARHAEKAEKS